MFKYRITKTTTSESVGELEINAKTEEEAIELASEYTNDIDGIIKLVGGLDSGFDSEIVVASVEEYPRIKKKGANKC